MKLNIAATVFCMVTGILWLLLGNHSAAAAWTVGGLVISFCGRQP
jgi:hypothetical protein